NDKSCSAESVVLHRQNTPPLTTTHSLSHSHTHTHTHATHKQPHHRDPPTDTHTHTHTHTHTLTHTHTKYFELTGQPWLELLRPEVGRVSTRPTQLKGL